MSPMLLLTTCSPSKSLIYPPFLSRISLKLHPNVLSFQPTRLNVVPHLRIRSFQHEDVENYEATKSVHTPDSQDKDINELLVHPVKTTTGPGNPFLAKLAIALDASNVFTFKAFGYRVMLPESAPGWIYFWLLMAAGFGLFISEEALNIWVGISLARRLTLDGTWLSFAESFTRNASHITSTILWVYWGVCISDMVPFYIGKFFRTSGTTNDVCSKLGIGKEKAVSITRNVQRYGNLIGFVERFSLGVRNPTAFLAGALGISPEFFFAGVCCGGLITLPLQLGIGFLLRERPAFAIATVATVVGIWTLVPYAVAALTALFLYLRQRYSS
ncbi:SNARE associated Golgi protein family [Heracleum sosnowskyi]|uniref:SNARE associated Golgi protein family n=1 Tax=Heracleum sosnowskyi TaxID=360622 RepID=A0AAD8M176_9APIA|nr:SNARE associated Golgi protein family [Heracleum sosnowskyi]